MKDALLAFLGEYFLVIPAVGTSPEFDHPARHMETAPNGTTTLTLAHIADVDDHHTRIIHHPDQIKRFDFLNPGERIYVDDGGLGMDLTRGGADLSDLSSAAPDATHNRRVIQERHTDQITAQANLKPSTIRQAGNLGGGLGDRADGAGQVIPD